MTDAHHCDALKSLDSDPDNALDVLHRDGPFVALAQVEASVKAAYQEGWQARHDLRQPDAQDVGNDWMTSEARQALMARKAL
ncbi:MAG: hypothetical protein AAF213_01815 [Pseudomonadota bacterium]